MGLGFRALRFRALRFRALRVYRVLRFRVLRFRVLGLRLRIWVVKTSEVRSWETGAREDSKTPQLRNIPLNLVGGVPP